MTFKGIRLQRWRDVDVLETITVDNVMETEIDTLRESDSLTVAIDLLMRKRYHGLPVLNDDGELTGIITVQDIDHIQSDGSDMMHTIGLLRNTGIARTYDLAVTRRAAIRHSAY
ncbi:MAG: CBS domain-containing protein [Candidatus Kuenenia stuttgartiensis]|nr:MAG: CBS domain-containing protein [Candidatus Kuenenia stuttgartiensis]